MDKWDRLQILEDIKRLKARYFRMVDTHDAEGFANVFTPDGVLDLREAFTAPNMTEKATDNPTPVRPIVITGRDNILAAAKKGMDRISVHHGHMPEIDIQSETHATGIWSMEDIVWSGPGAKRAPKMHGYGHYHEVYEKLADGWRIKSCKLTRLYLHLE